MAAVHITWLGHASFRFETEAGEVIYFDPWISGNPACPIRLEEVDRADVVVVTHGHSDHLGQSIDICQRTGAVLVSSPEVCYYAHRQGIAYDQDSCVLNIGGTAKIGTIAYTMVQAFHSTSLAGARYREDRSVEPDGMVCGFVLTFENGVVIYDAADTGVFGDMALISQMYGPQIAILPCGGKYTMGIRECARAAGLIRPEVVIPCHYNTFPNQQADIRELDRQVRLLAPQTRVVELTPGEPWTYRRTQS